MDLNISIEKLVQYINLELKKDKNISVNRLCDRIGIKKSTLKSRMSRAEYTYNIELRQYIKVNTTSNTTSVSAEETIVLKEETSVIKEDTTSNITLLKDKNIDFNKLQLLLNNIDKLLNLVDAKQSNTSSITVESTETVVTSLRINKEIYGLIKEKSSKSNISISNIVNKALSDYLSNYI